MLGISRPGGPYQSQLPQGGRGIAGGGSGEKCNYSYSMHAVRLDRDRVNLFVDLSVHNQAVAKEITLMRGRDYVLQLEHDVRIVARY